MRQSDLREAREFAHNYGCKSVVYGPPGIGKTPIVDTAPRPVLGVAEPGLLSMRKSRTPTYVMDTWKRVQEFFEWVEKSSECAKNFDTIAVDSISQICEIHIKENPRNKAHGLPRYGAMAEDVGDILYKLYYLKNKHTYIIGKQEIADGFKRPYFPGKELPIKVPHLFDAILHLDKHVIPGYGVAVAFHCHSAIDAACRDRSGMLAEYEPTNLKAIFEKTMQQPV